MWDALFNTTEGWLIVAVTLISVALAVGFKCFFSHQIKKDAALAQKQQSDVNQD